MKTINQLSFFKNHTFARKDLNYAITYTSKNPGKNLVFTGAVHGSEPSGIDSAIEIINGMDSKKYNLKSGSITWILANPEGFLQSKRYVDDNMNRVFGLADLNNPGDSIEKNRAKEIANWAEKQKIDLWVDFHSTSSSDEPMIVILQEHDRTDLASKITNFSTYFVISKKTLSASLMQFCEEKNIPSFVLECGLHTNPVATVRAKENMLSILSYHDIFEQKIDLKKPEKVEIYTATNTLDATEGFSWNIDKKRLITGEKIIANELLASDKQNQYKYLQDLYLMMPDANPTTGDKGIAFLCHKNSIN